MFRLTALVLAVFISLAGSLAPAQAQGGRFAPVIRVGDGIITRYQLDQRTLFLQLLRAPDPRGIAKEQLINESIQLAEARRLGLTPSPDAVAAGLAEFAGRAELTTDEFITALGANGVDPETFRDFIEAGVAWREIVRAELGDDVRATIPDQLVDRTLALTGTEGGTRVLLLEVLLPTQTPETRRASQSRAAEIAAIGDEEAFSTAARRFSIAPTRANGGQLDWEAFETLPPEVQAAVRGLAEGQTSRPVTLEGGGIAIYHLVDREVVRAGKPGELAVDYALLITGSDTGTPTQVLSRIDVCDDLYGVAKGLPEARLIRETVPATALPADIASEVGTLDVGEASTVTRAGRPALLMLCSRTAAIESTVDRNIVGNRILNTRLGAVASAYLQELRARTTIVDLTE